MIVEHNDNNSLKEFKKKDQLIIVNRKAPEESDYFFEKLLKYPQTTTGKVRRQFAKQDIHSILNNKTPKHIMSEPFYEKWLIDMAEVTKMFCNLLKEEAICFWLGSNRGCKRYHVDIVPVRMLVTYAGQGTEILPDQAANRDAFINGEPNEKIVKDKLAIQFVNKWDISLFRGGKKGILHRSPDSSKNGQSILMRLDHFSFWDKIKSYRNQ